MRLSIYLVLAIPMLASCAIQPETGVVSRVEIVEFGIEVQNEENPDQRIQLQETDKIYFQKGIKYGVVFRVLGEPVGSSVQLKLLWITTPGSRTTRTARSQLFTRKMSVEVGESIYMASRTSWDSALRRPYRAKFVVGHNDGTVYLEKDFWIFDSEEQE